jgi:hypothetical protein
MLTPFASFQGKVVLLVCPARLKHFQEKWKSGFPAIRPIPGPGASGKILSPICPGAQCHGRTVPVTPALVRNRFMKGLGIERAGVLDGQICFYLL